MKQIIKFYCESPILWIFTAFIVIIVLIAIKAGANISMFACY
jgi:hypothetical protein